MQNITSRTAVVKVSRVALRCSCSCP